MYSWMLAAILFCGLALTSCSKEDNATSEPAVPDTKALNAELAGIWYEEYEPETPVSYNIGEDVFYASSLVDVAVFNPDGTGCFYRYYFNDEDHDDCMSYGGGGSFDEDEGGKFHYTSYSDGRVQVVLDDKDNTEFLDTVEYTYVNGELYYDVYDGSAQTRAAKSHTLQRGDETLKAMMDEWKTTGGKPGEESATPEDLKDVKYTILKTGVQSIKELIERAFAKQDDQFAEVAGQTYNGSQKPAATRAFNIKVPTFFYRYFHYSYESTDATGKPVTLSARVSWGGNKLTSNFYEARPCYIILNPHFTITTDLSSPTSGNAYEIPFMSGNLLLIQPDYQGFGITKDMDQAYINHEVCARQCIDALKAGYKLFCDLGNVKMESNWKLYVAGCSQGGGNSLACHKWFDTHEDFAKAWRFQYSYCGSGPHSPRITFEEYFKQKDIAYPVVFPVVIRSMKMSYPDILGKYDEKEFFSEKYNTIKADIDKMVASKRYNSDQINAKFFENFTVTTDKKGNKTVKLSDLLSEKAMDMNSDLCKALFECFDKNDLTKGWTPKRPIYLFHGKGDLVVPYANSEAVKAAFPDKVTLYTERFGYDDHLNSCAQFLFHVASANW